MCFFFQSQRKIKVSFQAAFPQVPADLFQLVPSVTCGAGSGAADQSCKHCKALQQGLGCWQQFAMQPVLPAEGLFPQETIGTACTPQSCSSCPSFSSYSRRAVTAAAHRQPPPGAAAEGPILVLFLSHSPPERGAFPSCNSPQTPQCCPGLSLSRAGQEESSGTGVPGPFPGWHAVLGHKGAEVRLSQLVAGPSLLANHTRPAHWAERKISACTSSFCGRRADGWGAGSIQLPRALRGDEI